MILHGGENGKKIIYRVNMQLNSLNVELHRAIRDADNSFVSRTILESTRYSPQKISVLRSVTVNPLTTKNILREILEEHNRLGMKIYGSGYDSLIKKTISGKKVKTPLEGEFY